MLDIKSVEEPDKSQLSVGKVLRYRHHPIGRGFPKVAALLLGRLVALTWRRRIGWTRRGELERLILPEANC